MRAVSGTLKVAFLKAMNIQSAFSDDSCKWGKNEYAALKIIGQGRFLQSMALDKIYFPEQ